VVIIVTTLPGVSPLLNSKLKDLARIVPAS
jgi:hypothetical protein